MLTDVFVPLLTYPDDARTNSLPQLAALLDVFATHVTFCGVEINVPGLADRWGGALISLPQMVAEVEQRSRENATGLLANATSLSTNFLANKITVRAAFGSPGQTIAQKARNYDLTALSLKRGSVDQVALAEDIIFGSGRPLVIAPEGIGYLADLSRIALAWDGSPTASRALFDSMPLLLKATDVVVLTADEDKPIPKTSIEALTGYLGRHGVKSRPVPVKPGSMGIGRALQEAAASEEAGMLVMGAYGHSRLREFVLGGATAGVLNDPLLPTFFSR